MCYKHPRHKKQQMNTKEKGSPTSRADAGIAFRHTNQMWLGLCITIFDSMGVALVYTVHIGVTTAFPYLEEGGKIRCCASPRVSQTPTLQATVLWSLGLLKMSSK